MLVHKEIVQAHTTYGYAYKEILYYLSQVKHVHVYGSYIINPVL